MKLDKEDIRKSLLKKGFQKSSNKKGKSKDHEHFTFYDNGKPTIAKTYMSSGGKKGKTINDFLIGEMARQCYLNKNQFVNLVDCSMTKCDYTNHISNQQLPNRRPPQNAGNK